MRLDVDVGLDETLDQLAVPQWVLWWSCVDEA